MESRRSWSDGSFIQWQAHRGGGGFERPDNTLTSFKYGWDRGGIPEADVRQTSDGVIVCLHDPTLERTTDAPDGLARVPVTELEYSTFAAVDAGARFAPKYAGERIPLLADVFACMQARPASRLYLDLKDIDLARLAGLIAGHALGGRLCVCSSDPEKCAEMQARVPGLYTMLWCGGAAAKIERKFEAVAGRDFVGLNQVQLHLNDGDGRNGWRYDLRRDFVRQALKTTAAKDVDLQVFPWKFDAGEIETLLDLGVRWYVTDEVTRFLGAMNGWLAAHQVRN